MVTVKAHSSIRATKDGHLRCEGDFGAAVEDECKERNSEEAAGECGRASSSLSRDSKGVDSDVLEDLLDRCDLVDCMEAGRELDDARGGESMVL
jgi:hypothetical protein